MSGHGPTPIRPPVGSTLGTISVLVEGARAGDPRAREQLARRCVEALLRFAHGRVPRGARARIDSSDLVQSAVGRAFERLDAFERRGHGSFLAHLRTIVLNQIRDEASRVAARAPHGEPAEALADPGPSPLDDAIGRDVVPAYEAALARLPEDQRTAVVLRLEMGFSYQEIADSLGSASANATRMTITRALVRLAREMEAHGPAAG